MTADDIYRVVSSMVLTKVSPNAWRAEDCPTMVVAIKCPKIVQEEFGKLAAIWSANQADLETKLFSALVLDGIWHNIEADKARDNVLFDDGSPIRKESTH